MLPSATGLRDVKEKPVENSELSHRLEKVWTSEGNWVDVDRDTKTGAIYGLRSIHGDKATQTWTGEVCQIDSTGGVVKAITVGGSTHPPNWLRVLRDDTNGTVAFATGLIWRSTVRVYEAEGSLLWSKQYDGVSSLRAADIDGDGVDELLVATMNGLFAERLNGSTQWHALGKRHVADVAHLRDFVLVQVSSNKIVTLSTDGVINHEQKARSQYQVVVLLPSDNEKGKALGLAIPQVDVISADGSIHRRLTIRGHQLTNGIVSDAVVTPDGKWLAVICKEGSVAVIDVAIDRVVSFARLDVHLYPKIEWMPSNDGCSYDLVVASARGTNAYAMRPVLRDAEPEKSTE
jgi:WD40 repeat protein